MKLTRRHFIGRSGLVTLAFAGLQRFVESSGFAADAAKAESALDADFHGTLDLLPDFSYTIFSETSDKMDDGLLVPGKHDGMGAFAGPGGRAILVRNHELDTGPVEQSPFGTKRALLRKVPRNKLYDGGKGKKPGLGGTTTLVYDTKKQRLDKHFLSLAGTYRNCAGGVTPWGTWVTCEEDCSRPNEGGQLPEDEMERDHGYNFEVPASDKMGLVDPVPLKAMGRFRHEAVAVDPRSGVVYQTEDRSDGLFYRFIPATRGKLAGGGRLQALKLRDKTQADTRNWSERGIRPGQKLDVEWVDVTNVESLDDDLRYQGYYEHSATRFARAEGAWHGNDAVYFACTNGGTKRKGQIWRYVPSPDEGTPAENRQPGQLELFIEPNEGKLVENADNLCVAPWGDLILTEDGVSPHYVVGVTPAGKIYKLAKTSLGEMAGACFSPDGSTLFVNIQTPGLTAAITGPWKSLQKYAV